MHKDEVKRIMNLVKEGKLSPEDAAELIEAFEEDRAQGEPTPPPPPKGESKDQFSSIADTIERIGRDVAGAVDWKEVSDNIRTGAKKGADALKRAIEEAKEGRFAFTLFGFVESKKVELPLNMGSGKILKIENPTGDIKVIGTTEPAKLVAEAMVRGHNAEEAKTRAETFTPVIEEGDGFVAIRQVEMSGMSVDIVVHVPYETQVEIRSRAGDVEVRDTRHSCRVNGTSGDVKIHGASGQVEVQTTQGDVELMDCKATLVAIENSSGNIRLVEVAASMNLRTASGDVTLERCTVDRTLSVEAVSGDISIDIREPLQGAQTVRTVSGDVLMTVSDGCDCRVSLSSMTGSVDCLLDLADHARSERRVTGQLGHGNGTLDVSAISGDIRIRQRVHT